MKNNISVIRNNYLKGSLSEDELPANPFVLFKDWLQSAIDFPESEPTAMALSTSTNEGMPSSRIVLLKDVNETGFRFFTNYDSRKGRELFLNPAAALLFFWPQLERQIRVEGQVERVSEEDSDAYFMQRPIESQLGAWASPQSKVIPGRIILENRMEHTRSRFEGKSIPRPPHWGGFVLIPASIEFWQGREGRMHDRLKYSKKMKEWKIERLAP
jgi:pyridoxamine 5'-phosphate oxidase